MIEYRVTVQIQTRDPDRSLVWEKSIWETVTTPPTREMEDVFNRFVEARTALAQAGMILRE